MFDRFERLTAILGHIPKSDLSLLDVGCGGWGSCIPPDSRPLARTLRQRVGVYVGIERDADKAQRLKDMGLDVRCQQAELFSVEQKFDVVFLGLTLMYCRDMVAVMKRVGEHLKPGGLVVIDVPNVWYGPRIVKYVLTGDYSMAHDEYNKYLFDKIHLKKFVEESGFRVEEVRYVRGRARERLFPRRFAQFVFISARKI